MFWLGLIWDFFYFNRGWSITPLVSSGTWRRVWCFLLLHWSFDWGTSFPFILAGSRIATRVILEATSWIVFSWEWELWKLSSRSWSLSSIVFEFYFRTMLSTFFNNSLGPCMLRFICKVWKPGNVSCYIARSRTWVSCGLTGTDLTIYEARIRSVCEGTTTLGSMAFYDGGRCDWLLYAKAAATSFHAVVDLVVLDPSISI